MLLLQLNELQLDVANPELARMRDLSLDLRGYLLFDCFLDFEVDLVRHSLIYLLCQFLDSLGCLLVVLVYSLVHSLIGVVYDSVNDRSHEVFGCGLQFLVE